MTAYATTLEVFEFLQWVKEIPEFVSGSTPALEEVDDSGTLANGSIIYLDHNRVVAGSYTISYGAGPTSVTALTETTHYTIDVDSGKITITTAGATAIGSNNVYASYKYVEIEGQAGMSDSYVSDLIDRATALFDEFMNQTFQAVAQTVQESHTGKGRWGKRYRPFNLPIFGAITNLDGDVTSSDTTFTVTSTTNFAADMYLSVGTEVVSIDSVDDSTTLTVTRGELGSTAAAHSDEDLIANGVVEISNTPEGSLPTFTVLEFRKDWTAEATSNLVTIQFADTVPNDITTNTYPELRIPHRVRLTYSYGAASVPAPITQACVEQVARWLTSSAVARGLAQGVDGFTPRANEILSDDIKQILREYRLLRADGF